MTENGQALTVIDQHQLAIIEQQMVVKWPQDMRAHPALARQMAEITLQAGLDPSQEEIIPFQGKPYITYPGRWRKAMENPKFGGIADDRPARPDEYELLHVDPKQNVLWYFAIFIKGWAKPYGNYGRVSVNDVSPVAKQKGFEIAKKRAGWRTFRDALPLRILGLQENEDVGIEGDGPGDDWAPQLHASKGQLAAIHALVKAMEWSNTDYRSELTERFGVKSSADLTSFQAQDFLDYLGEAAERKQFQKTNKASLDAASAVFGDFDGEQGEPEQVIEGEVVEQPTEQPPTAIERNVSTLKPTTGGPFCCGCGVAIEDAKIYGKPYTAQEIVNITTKAFNEPLCPACFEARKKRAS